MSPAAARRRVTITPRTVRTRRIAFEYPPERLPRHYVGGDLVMSHVVTVLSSFFPEGEDFFIRSVRNYRDRVTDPELKAQVAGFIGQEVTHSREHRNFNDRLGALGYPTRQIDRAIGALLRFGDRTTPRSSRLAVTAALEHYTATLAEVLLTDARAREMFDVDEVRSMLEWHALEENEHKSVAFDVYQTAVGNQFRRVWTMRVTTVSFLGITILATVYSLLRDPVVYRQPRRLAASLRGLRHSPWLTPEVARHIRDYNRRDFHPDDHDTTALIEEWKVRLFGTEGELTERTKGRPEEATPS
ncbi:metal-dependent hydrolase [Actinomadura hibisca]|uniref:metal-dependent hydrolase n=1 Tax=Actinomadura hibisca TaxID=68565 RepID=UPI00082D7605|nr:metal-dependent hydrolase [Actinomadura hibisca]